MSHYIHQIINSGCLPLFVIQFILKHNDNDYNDSKTDTHDVGLELYMTWKMLVINRWKRVKLQQIQCTRVVSLISITSFYLYNFHTHNVSLRCSKFIFDFFFTSLFLVRQRSKGFCSRPHEGRHRTPFLIDQRRPFFV